MCENVGEGTEIEREMGRDGERERREQKRHQRALFLRLVKVPWDVDDLFPRRERVVEKQQTLLEVSFQLALTWRLCRSGESNRIQDSGGEYLLVGLDEVHHDDRTAVRVEQFAEMDCGGDFDQLCALRPVTAFVRNVAS